MVMLGVHLTNLLARVGMWPTLCFCQRPCTRAMGLYEILWPELPQVNGFSVTRELTS